MPRGPDAATRKRAELGSAIVEEVASHGLTWPEPDDLAPYPDPAHPILWHYGLTKMGYLTRRALEDRRARYARADRPWPGPSAYMDLRTDLPRHRW